MPRDRTGRSRARSSAARSWLGLATWGTYSFYLAQPSGTVAENAREAVVTTSDDARSGRRSRTQLLGGALAMIHAGLGIGELVVRLDEPWPLLFWLPTLWGSAILTAVGLCVVRSSALRITLVSAGVLLGVPPRSGPSSSPPPAASSSCWSPARPFDTSCRRADRPLADGSCVDLSVQGTERWTRHCVSRRRRMRPGGSRPDLPGQLAPAAPARDRRWAPPGRARRARSSPAPV